MAFFFRSFVCSDYSVRRIFLSMMMMQLSSSSSLSELGSTVNFSALGPAICICCFRLFRSHTKKATGAVVKYRYAHGFSFLEKKRVVRLPREPREGSPGRGAQQMPSESPAAEPLKDPPNNKRPSVGEKECVLGSPGNSLVGLRGARRTKQEAPRLLGFFVLASRLWKKKGANCTEL